MVRLQLVASLLAVLCVLPLTAAEWKPDVGLSFTSYLKTEAGEVWHAATHHPMSDAIAAGTVPNSTMRRYLIQDHLFIDAFSSLLAATISITAKIEDRVPLAQFLALILGPENTYFERSFEALGVSKDERAAAAANPLPPTSAFIRLMQSAAHSSKLEEMLAVLVVAEWSYLEWGERVHAPVDTTIPFWFQEWVDLHRGAGFSAIVAHLRSLLDSLATGLDHAALSRSRSNFLEAIALERDFWDMAWTGKAPGKASSDEL